jgi:hypothetical protein
VLDQVTRLLVDLEGTAGPVIGNGPLRTVGWFTSLFRSC